MFLKEPCCAGTLLTIDYGGNYTMDDFLHLSCYPSSAEGARAQVRWLACFRLLQPLGLVLPDLRVYIACLPAH